MDARSQSRVSPICRVDAWLTSSQVDVRLAPLSPVGRICCCVFNVSWFTPFCHSVLQLLMWKLEPLFSSPDHTSRLVYNPCVSQSDALSIITTITTGGSRSSPLNPSAAIATETISSPRGTCHQFLRITHRRQEAIYSWSYGCTQEPVEKSFGCPTQCKFQ